jgi:hypothetical protein
MAEPSTTTSPVRLPVWPKDALRIAFGVIWAIDATF